MPSQDAFRILVVVLAAPLVRADERERPAVVKEIEFSGNLAFTPKQLQKSMRATRGDTMIPFLWRSRAPFTGEALDSDLLRLKSHYLSHGYFDAEVRTANIRRDGRNVTVNISIDAGQRYEAPKTRELCECLLDARRQAWRDGRIDFAAVLRVAEAGGNRAYLKAGLQPGPRYRVGRIEFLGNKRVSDSTLRRAMALDEGAAFDPGRLLLSIARINRTSLFEPLSGNSISIRRDPVSETAGITINLNQAKIGRWLISGPVGPPGVAGPLRASVMSRLPDWGPNFLQTSTWHATLSITAFSFPARRLLPWLSGRRSVVPLLAVSRPVLPGQEWTSGFLLSPQAGLNDTAASYLLNQARDRANTVLRGEWPGSPELVVPVEFPRKPNRAGALICEPTKSRWSILRSVSATGLDLLLAGGIV